MVTSTSASISTSESPPSSTPTTSTTSQPSSEKFVDSPSPSCKKCVKVLRDLIVGLKKDDGHPNNNTQESPPLTLLRAIAGGAISKELNIETIEDGIKMQLPVQTTLPTLLRRWSAWTGQQDGDTNESVVGLPHTLATSMNDDAATAITIPEKDNIEGGGGEPLTIELKCRKCASTGPESGARAFLMGPSPLSVVVCHNRIQSQIQEVEEILTHELVHLYDVQTLQLDLQQCENLAYSEVRAAKAAECRDSWSQLQSYCVKQKAICATNNLFPQEGRKCIQKVFDKAFQDDRPFSSPSSS